MTKAHFAVRELGLQGVKIVTPLLRTDERGFLVETYNAEEFQSLGITATFVQDVVSFSKQNVIRGLHIQRAPQGQAKLMRCVSGRAFVVVADVDPASVSFRTVTSVELSGDTQAMLYIPDGYANGFCALTDVLMEYKLSRKTHPEYASGILYSDPAFNISWPVSDPIISEKDSRWPTL